MAIRRDFSGKGSPEGAVVADIGSFYLRDDGSAGTVLYIKESGSGNTGWVAYQSAQILSATVALSKTVIVGNSAGDIGHADGVQLVAAVATKIIHPVAVVVTFTYATAAYSDGDDISARYKDGGAITGVVTETASLGASASNVNTLSPVAGLALVNKDLVLRSAAAFSDPGTAAGTASVTTHYVLL